MGALGTNGLIRVSPSEKAKLQRQILLAEFSLIYVVNTWWTEALLFKIFWQMRLKMSSPNSSHIFRIQDLKVIGAV